MKSPMFMGGSRLVCRSRERDLGAALVIVLACIVILTGLIVAFLGHAVMETQVSGASAEQSSATLFARGAVDSVIGETIQEITAGSTAFYPSGSDVRDPNCFYLPVTNAAMVPYRMDSGAPANVYKRSSWNEPFYQGTFYNSTWPAPTWAAHYSTTNADSNGRTITMARWNTPLLMPKLNTTVTDLTPATGFIPPDWIYMTRTAGPATTWNANLSPNLAAGTLNPNQVVGRYAYVVYDEGGLLDANAAGYPTTGSTAAISASAMRQKISEACADLTQIGLQATDINSLVTWRNPNNGASSNAYYNYVYGPANPGSVNATGEATNGFLTPASGERVFTSRQQLIDFLTQYVPNGDTTTEARLQGALPYLTHFSRELNAPSWYPEVNAASSGAYAYSSNSTNVPATANNIFAPLQRASATFTDPTNSLTTLPNQSVAYSRFPLSRLSWLGSSGPNGATAAQILESFGLSWDGSNYAWQYVGSDGSGSVLSAIKPLNSITGRAPNFFELLKAGILSGSVGMYASADGMPLNTIDTRYTGAAGAGNPDQHIMQIGLSIMDQVSASPLPCRIEFGANTGTLALYGTKNLPYLYKLAFAPYRASNNLGTFQAWLEPILWNPYVTGTTASSKLSLELEIANGTVTTWMKYQNTPGHYDNIPTTPALGTAGNTSGTITIAENSPGALAALTTSPNYLIHMTTVGSVTGESTFSDPIGSYLYFGFWLGSIPFPVFDPGANSTSYVNNCVPFFSPNSAANPPQFVMLANYGGGNYQEVERMNFNAGGSGAWATDLTAGTSQFTVLGRHYQYYTNPDPRTGRFGFNYNYFSGYNYANYQYASTPVPLNGSTAPNEVASGTWTTFSSPSQNFAGAIDSLPNPNTTLGLNYGTTASGGGWSTGGSPYRFADNSYPVSGAFAVSSPAYTDPDSVQRRGDAWWNNAAISSSDNTLPMRTDPAGYPAYRPVLLERNLDSVGELGYAFRDLPWRSLDFCTANSADAGLLDFFTVNDGYAGNTNSPVVGGRIDLNTAQAPVLEAMLNGAYRAQLDPTYDISSSDAGLIATKVAQIASAQPLLNKSEIATRLAPNDPTVQPGATSEPGIDTNIKERREALVRALASTGQVRTWNLLIDVIAQTGHMPPNATGFNNFVATAEQRYWAHVAIDRFTGQVVSLQLEPVSQ
jgi:hypothetical protein